ncbi:MAG: tRNA lysidine(34) synthetase TilS [Victivallales bacterium]|nr:tRNA lysidine(34) synthetase TilS [Victivallales bacterium]
MNLQEAVHNFLQKYALLGRDVLCGFSGGADSTSLLLALSREQLGGLTAVHFHHGIRGAEADADAEWSRAFCEKRGIRLELIYLNVPENMLPGEATEEAARRLRLENWERLSNGTRPVFLAHHADDAMEELFLRLARGSNVSALVPMKPYRRLRGIALCRPLLGLRRSEIEAFLLENGIDDWRIDGTNSDSHYRRNALRNELLPLFRRIFGNDAGLLRSMENLSCDADFIEECAAHLELNDIGKWQSLHQAVLFRAVRGLLERNFHEVPPLTYNFIQRLQTELARFKGKPVTLPLNENVCFRLERCGLRVVKNAPEWSVQRWNWRNARDFYLPGWHFSIVDGPGEGIEAFDEALLPEELVIRTRLPGDRMEPFGSKGKTKKLQDIFTEAKIPLEQRSTWPVVLADDVIIWLPKLRRAQFAPITANTKNIYINAEALFLTQRRSF